MPTMKPRISAEERQAREKELQRQLADGEVTIGEAVREMRQRWLGLKQAQYARLCRVSKNTLGAIERDELTVSVTSLQAVIRPLGYCLTLTPVVSR